MFKPAFGKTAMTIPLYHTDAYCQAFEAVVTAVDGSAVALDRTAFYPGGGGQPNDVGSLSASGQTWAVTKVRIVEIVGLDLQADGGTHVANTSEVGRIRIVDYKSKGKINKRIEVEILDA